MRPDGIVSVLRTSSNELVSSRVSKISPFPFLLSLSLPLPLSLSLSLHRIQMKKSTDAFVTHSFVRSSPLSDSRADLGSPQENYREIIRFHCSTNAIIKVGESRI